jgi:hypothetical protein
MKKYNNSSYNAIKTFTYFIPAPPNRKSGYREKEFDKIFFELLKKDFEILNFKTQSAQNGMWIICLLGATTEEAAILDLDIHQDFGLNERGYCEDIIFEDPSQQEDSQE